MYNINKTPINQDVQKRNRVTDKKNKLSETRKTMIKPQKVSKFTLRPPEKN